VARFAGDGVRRVVLRLQAPIAGKRGACTLSVAHKKTRISAGFLLTLEA
jgi:hypothetical protein